jgi:hypothetical protein
LQVGELDFRLTRSWRISAGGGVDYSRYNERDEFRENVSAGISYTSRRSLFTATYQRGLTSAIGISGILSSEVATGGYGYRVTRWMSARVEAYYYRSSELYSNGLLETLSGGGGLEFALRRNLSMTLNAFYQDQRTDRFSIEGLELNRFTGYLGIQYVWPSRRRSEY